MSGIKRQSPFETLGVSPAATKAEIRKAWKALVKANHPDRNPTDREAATDRLVAVNAAYDKLRNHEPIILTSFEAHAAKKAQAEKAATEARAQREAAQQAAKARAHAHRQAEIKRQVQAEAARKAAKPAPQRIYSTAELQAMHTAKREFTSAQMAFHAAQAHVFSTAA